MDTPDRLEAKGLARAKIRAKRRRVQTIRRRTLRGSLALFAIVWALVFAQLVSGNDPALSRIPHASHRPVASTGSDLAREPAPEAEPEEEFASEAEPGVAPEEEFAPEPEPEPEPIVTASS